MQNLARSVGVLRRSILSAAALLLAMVLIASSGMASIHEPETTPDGSLLASSHESGVSFDAEEDYVRKLLDDPAAPQLGNPAGDVTVYEFFDYNCPYCKRVAADVMRLVEDDANLRIVFKEYPILSEDSKLAAQAALAAHKQGKYLLMHEALMKHRGRFTRTILIEIARNIGADPHVLLSDMSSPDIEAQITRNLDLATLLSLRGTPNFIIGSFLIPGAISYEDMKKVIAEARRRG